MVSETWGRKGEDKGIPGELHRGEEIEDVVAHAVWKDDSTRDKKERSRTI